MMRFNYLRSGAPEVIERFHSGYIPARLQTPLAALVTVVVAVCFWWGIENLLLHQAIAELHVQTARLNASRTALEKARLRRTRVESLLALDNRLRDIRRSGAQVAGELADIANHVPRRAWLTDIARVDQGMEVEGKAVGLDGLSDTVSDLMSSKSASLPELIHAARDGGTDSTPTMTFTLHLQSHR
jgi:Tfp pilus assembly protein PilN